MINMNNMHIRNIDLNLLVVFDALMRERSVSRAAEGLGMSQSGVSHALARLRGLTGDPLFLRKQRMLVPTAKAEAMAPLVARGLGDLTHAVAPSRDFNLASDTTEFHLLLPDLGETLFLPALLNIFAAQAPHMRVDIRPGFGRGFVDEIARGQLHVAMELVPPDRSDIGCAKWFTSDLVAVSNGPQYADKQDLTLSDYARARHILYRPPGLPEPPLEALLKEQGLKRDHSAQTATLSALMFVAAETDCLATVPRRLAEAFAARTNVHTMELPFMSQELESYLWWPRANEEAPAHRWLRETMLDLP